MAKYSKKNRAIVSGIMVGVATIFALASHFDIGTSQLSSFMISTVLFFLVIVLGAAITLLVIKGISKILHRKKDSNDDA